MKRPAFYFSFFFFHFLFLLSAAAQTFDFSGNKKAAEGAVRVTPDMRYSAETGYGYDFTASPQPSPKGKGAASGGNQVSPPLGGEGGGFFSVAVPDGNYKVTLTLGSRRRAGVTTVRAESRRLLLESVPTKKGELKTFTFTVNKRTPFISGNDYVRIKPREKNKLNWDERLTIEVCGASPQLAMLKIEPADAAVTTLYLCGNSTVVDQDYEPWASWGQMIPRWFDETVSVANYAESGESASSFLAAGRLKKILAHLRAGDYVFVEFGHNDQKQRGPGKGAYYNFATELKTFVDEVRARNAHIVFVTPTQRRSFDAAGKIQETHADYPDAMRWVAGREEVPLIELHDMTRTFFETLGVEGSKKALVHYPANSYPNQPQALADNTHFNPYGAYEVAKMVVEGMKQLHLPLADHLRPDYVDYDPAHPDDPTTFHWDESTFFEVEKPDGN